MLCVQLNQIEASHLFPCSLTVVLASDPQTHQYPSLETQGPQIRTKHVRENNHR